MASGTLYTYPENFRAYKALIAAQYSGAKVKIAEDFIFGETNKSDAFLKKFPLGKVPAFETADGKYITESNAIAYYVANEQLRGKTDIERAEIVQWFGFADSEILPASCAWVFPLLGLMQYNKQTIEHAKDDVKKALTALNSHLLTRTYLVGERLTLADISVATTLLHLYQYILEPSLRKPYQNVNRWFQTVIYQPESINVIGAFKLADKTLEYDPKKFADVQEKSSAKKEKKEKRKEQKKEPKEPREADVDLADEIAAAEPKSKDPFDTMPKGTFDMDSFKRCYSNEEETVSIPFFWKEFDPEHYSIWFGEYKYPEELTKVFMSCNLIGGMYQRLDKMRKAAFASVCLFGEDNNSTISGIWVWRGQDLAFTLSPDWQIDYESYKWEKLDPNKDETKALVKQYFSWTGTDKQGRKFNQGKIFK
ncbi:elongation factor 1-gamma [Neodiprion pinetum]|uniref:Elongation factor 1-gamma n=1 Tax=Neodiprion lecontei TaxID=441921 RepID=A0A6J0BCW2_NEOLC|nr:elongation factor 1-gamma [Neodiprion lecontei]XP_046430723.1 elongation factor 1-gamma [Neodiprion fabricii]XP_046487848.1 elongation factor 1-gamma [Neodiprion pinetum]XP_046624513.1 elongation factor 1-gamma [Neodiprion virginianus]